MGYVNPASQHRPGQTARAKLEQYRREVLSMLGAKTDGMRSDVLIFTSGGTESNNLAVHGLAYLGRQQWLKKHTSSMTNESTFRVIISAIEHPAVLGAAEQLARAGFDVRTLPVDEHGVCHPEQLSTLLDGPVALVSVMLANNETGAVQPIRQIADLCKENDVFFHTDAVQAVGKIPVCFSDLSVDALSFTAHKFGGPRGIGGLVLRNGVIPEPILFGGFQQMAIRPGTEDVALVAGLWQALSDFSINPIQNQSNLEALRDRLQNKLKQLIPGLTVNSEHVDRVPQTLNISIPGIPRQNFLMAADLAGLAISTGSACASGSSDPSPVLLAMKLPKSVVDNSIRISVGYSNHLQEIDEAIDRIRKIVDR